MLTEERKAVLIEALRGHSVATENITPEYEENLKLSVREEYEVETEAGTAKVYVFTAKNREDHCPVHINVHGGGFVRGHQRRDEIWSSRVADAIKGITVDVDYCLAPEHPFPEPFQQVYDCVKWVFSKLPDWDADEKRVSMGGYSAGANLTAVTALKANLTGDFRLRLQLLGYGLYDNSVRAEDLPAVEGNIIPAERLNMFTEAYTDGEPERAKDIFMSPELALEEQLCGLPEALIIMAGRDNFRYDSEAYAARLYHAGVRVTLRCYRESLHGFIIHCNGEWEAAQELILEKLKTI